MKTLRDYIDIVNTPMLIEETAQHGNIMMLEAHEFYRVASIFEQTIVRELIKESRIAEAQCIIRHVNRIEIDEGVSKWMRNAAAAGMVGLAGLGAIPHAQAAEPVQQSQPAAVQQADSASAITQQMLALGSGADFQKWLGANMNLTEIGKQVAGDKWASATPEQQAALTQAIQQMFVNKYGSKIGFLKGKSFDLKQGPEVGGKAQVSGQLKGFWMGDVDLGFKMEKVNGQWKVDDIVARGKSIVDGIKSNCSNCQDINGLIQQLQSA